MFFATVQLLSAYFQLSSALTEGKKDNQGGTGGNGSLRNLQL